MKGFFLKLWSSSSLLCRCKRDLFQRRRVFNNSSMRVLNVAEKNDAAKNIASLLSNGASQRREGYSKYNKIYEFDYFIFNQNCKMVMTSVAGHLLNFEFASLYRAWNSCDPLALFDAPVSKQCPQDYQNIKKTLEREIKTCLKLIIWTDCDREGENIGYEIIQVCRQVKPNIEVYRAKFSEITRQSVQRALANLIPPDKNVSDAVDVRQELDLRIGAAFTRFQTLHLKRTFPEAFADSLISYGSCQFPTLGFVVERFKAITDFIPEPFWKLKVSDTKDNLTVEFVWKRVRLFNELACTVLYDTCLENPVATVEKVQSKPKSKWRPKPLDTVEMEKLASRKLRINAKETMRLAEKLYTQGYISYPRTETTIFPQDINLVPLVENQVPDPSWGEFAQRVLQDGPNPFQGNKSDQAHPPIHPTKYASQLSGQEKRLYELIVRHFLACLSKHAEGFETIVEIDVAREKFTAKGLMIIAKNYLDVYPYDKWNAKEIHIYEEGQTFTPTVEMVDGETGPPEPLTEADLIALMEKHGIGTDATHAEHIETIKARLYVGLKDEKYFVPKTLGMGLVEGYDSMGFEMSKPYLRSELEADLKRICEGVKKPEEVLREQIRKYKETFEAAQRHVQHLDDAIQTYLQIQPTAHGTADPPSFSSPQRVAPCAKCGMFLVLRSRRSGGSYIGCEGYPGCKEALWLPSFVLSVTPSSDTCRKCGPTTHLLDFKFTPGGSYLPTAYRGCIGGCDPILMDVLKGPSATVVSTQTSNHQVPPNDSSRHVQQNRSESGDNGFQLDQGGGPLSELDTFHCHCGRPAVKLSVKKAGPNQGRQFFKCDTPQSGTGCNFFQWVDSNSGPPRLPPSPRPGPSFPAALSSDVDIHCNCGAPAKRLTVQKEGPNKGRCFLCCRKAMGDRDRCDFFQWCDNQQTENITRNEPLHRNGGTSSSHSQPRARGGYTANKRRTTTQDMAGQAKKRKCGVCGEEGHNKRNCSQRQR